MPSATAVGLPEPDFTGLVLLPMLGLELWGMRALMLLAAEVSEGAEVAALALLTALWPGRWAAMAVVLTGALGLLESVSTPELGTSKALPVEGAADLMTDGAPGDMSMGSGEGGMDLMGVRKRVILS